MKLTLNGLELLKMAVDMSPRAVTERLRRVSQLRRLCLALKERQPLPLTLEQQRLAQQPKGDPVDEEKATE